MRPAFDHLLARLRFRHLQLLMEVERTGSLTRAAQALSLTQPAVSKALAELEQALGFALFIRGPRGLQLTASGALFTQGSALLVRELENIHTQALEASGTGRPGGVLRLGAPAFLAVTQLPELVPRLLLADPPIALQLHEASVPRLMQELQRGELDALITLFDAAVMGHSNRSVLFERFAEERYVVVAPPGHPAADGRALAWSALAEHPWVLTRKPSVARSFVDDNFRRHGVQPPQPVCETEGPVTAARMVAAGIGLSCVPEVIARETRVQRVKLRTAQPRATLGLAYPAASARHKHITALRSALDLT